MRNTKDIEAELESLGAPPLTIGFMRAPSALDARKRWCEEFPDKAARHDQLVEELEAIDAARETERKRKDFFNNCREDGLGERLLEAAYEDNLKPTPAVMATRDWLASGKTWLVLSGSVGTGKSVAAAMALLDEKPRRYASGVVFFGDRARGTVAFRRAASLVRMSAFNEGAAELALLKSVAMLVVDDLGTEHATSWGTSLIHEIFDTRHDDKLRTIITTNIPRDALKGALGDRLTDRIAQDGKVVCLEGKSMRRAPPVPEAAP